MGTLADRPECVSGFGGWPWGEAGHLISWREDVDNHGPAASGTDVESTSVGLVRLWVRLRHWVDLPACP
jgi:hypothetical protein